MKRRNQIPNLLRSKLFNTMSVLNGNAWDIVWNHLLDGLANILLDKVSNKVHQQIKAYEEA